MLASTSGNRQSRNPSPRKHNSRPTPDDQDIIIISDDELPPRRASKNAKVKSKSNAKRKAPSPIPFVDGDILEILTSEDDERELPPRKKHDYSTTNTPRGEVTALQNRLRTIQAVSINAPGVLDGRLTLS